MKTVSAVVTGAGQMGLQTFPVPEIGRDDLLLRVEQVSICGSDVKLYLGVRQNPAYPIIMGHEVVGRVAQVGEGAAARYGVKVGERIVVEPYISCNHCVYCVSGNYQLCTRLRCYGINLSCKKPPHLFGAYGEYMFVGVGSHVHPVPEHVPSNAASMSSVIANGIRWVQTKGKLQPGGTVAVYGPGAQGLASVIAAHEAGAAEIIVIGLRKDAGRLEFARRLGATRAIVIEDSDPIQEIRGLTGDGVDLAVECSGAPSAVTAAIESLHPQGTLVMAGVNEGKQSAIPHDRIVRKELNIAGGLGQVFLEVRRSIAIMATARYPIEQMVGRVFALEQADEGMRFFIEHPEAAIRVAISPERGKQ